MSKTLVKRILISMLIGIAIGAATSEIAFLFLRETARAPKEIVLTIPAGTAEQVARGEQPPALPESMVFVVGDVLIIKNEDTVDHQMGPFWIPAGASARLALSVEENRPRNISASRCANPSRLGRASSASCSRGFRWVF
jgi:hypothetical protein